MQTLTRCPYGIKTLTFENCQQGQHEVTMSFMVDDRRLTTNYYYPDVKLPKLEEYYGRDIVQSVYFHIMAFEAIPLLSLRPRRISLGSFARFWTAQFKTLWWTIFRKAGAQWRYENDLLYSKIPTLVDAPMAFPCAPIEMKFGPIEALSFNGGGKDSLVTMKLLEQGGISFSTYAYSKSIYGPADLQHGLIDELLNFSTPSVRHQKWTCDETWDYPLLDLQEAAGIKGLVHAETPSSIFGALPVVLQYGYRYIILGHELSADEGNFRWERTGEVVNHQWGKSMEAELLINQYIQNNLIANVSYFSLLKPIHDVLIFNLLGNNPEAVKSTHSCNVKKPWCGECAKCAYVWVNYMAYLPPEIVDSMFRENLLDVPVTQKWFRQLLGLGPYKPFECVGEVLETRLAFEICRQKGLIGDAMCLYNQEVPRLEVSTILDRYLAVRQDLTSIPPEVGRRVLPQMLEGANRARHYILSVINP